MPLSFWETDLLKSTHSAVELLEILLIKSTRKGYPAPPAYYTGYYNDLIDDRKHSKRNEINLQSKERTKFQFVSEKMCAYISGNYC